MNIRRLLKHDLFETRRSSGLTARDVQKSKNLIDNSILSHTAARAFLHEGNLAAECYICFEEHNILENIAILTHEWAIKS